MASRLSGPVPVTRSSRTILRRAVLVVAVALAAATVGAQSVPTGVQEYYVLGWEQHIWDMMDRVQNAQGGAQFADGMNSVVTATASADNQVIYYDHWEDLPDGELDNFPNVNPALLQASTLVIGDGDVTNGDVCDFNANIACGTDLLSAGDYVNFNSDRGLGGGCTTPGTPERCSVPLNPRSPGDIRFDGGDLIETTGGPLTVIHSQYPLTNFIGGSIEILSRQAVEAARSYSVPIGENLYAANTVTEPFHYVNLDLVAFEDTLITVDSPGAGSVSFALARGQHWSSQGFIDDAANPALALTINSGTKVSTTKPISGLIFTGGDGTWATRLYTLLPDILHSTDYVTTAPGDNPTGGPTTNGTPQNRPANVYILNPDLFTAIDVRIADSSGSYTVNIPANSMRSMMNLVPGRNIASNSTVRMTSDRSFWGVTAYDWDTNISDWGHSWLAKKFLTNFYTVSFGPGNQNQPPDNSQYANAVFVAATADRTRVQFDLDNNGTYDQVDLDGNGTADAAPFPGNTYSLNMLSALRVIDPTDNDMTGTRILANKPVAVSWGQDTDRSYFSDQALDTGFTVYPVNQLFLDPVLTIDKEVDTTVVPTGSTAASRTVTYTLTMRSYGFGPLTNVEVYDLLPTGVYGDTDYALGSTLITCPDLTQGTADPSFDDCTGGVQCRRLTWDIDGACTSPSPFTLGTANTLTVQYEVVIPVALGGTPRQLTNEAHAEARLGGSVFSPFDTAKVVQTDISLTKAVNVLAPAAGDVITFTLQAANTSTSVDETAVFITDAIPADTTFVPGSITATGAFAGSGVYSTAQNAVVWNAATFPFGTFATLSFQVRVNPTTPAGTEIPNRGGYESTQTPYFLSNEVEPVVLGPTLAAVKSISGSPSFVHPLEVVTFDIRIDNTGTAAATNLLLSDPFPANAAYVAGSMSWSLNSGPFTPLTDANDGVEGGGADGRALAARLEFRLASLGASQDVTLRFRVKVNTGTAGQFLTNQGTYASDQTTSVATNPVQVPIIGTAVINGHVFLDLNGNGVQNVGEPDIPNVDVAVSSVTPQAYTCAPGATITDGAYNGTQASMECCTITVPPGDFGAAPTISDLNLLMGVTHTWVGDLTIKVFGPGGQTLAALNRPGSTAADNGQNTPYGYASNWTGAAVTFDDDGGGPSAETLGSVGSDICSGDGICSYLPAPDTAGGLANLAGFDGLDPRGSWSVCVGDSVNADQGTFNFATLSFITNDSPTTTQIVTTDANGDYTAVVAGTAATINVSESDPDFPVGATLTTANDPQTITTVPGGSVTAPDTGYRQPTLIFTKTSNAVGNQVSPGQTVTYTLRATNNTGTTQTGLTLSDPLPTGTTHVPGSSQVQLPPQQVAVRVSQGSDDAEEDLGDGGMSLGNNDLDIVYANNTEQMVGVRFQGVGVPPGATVIGATIQFQADETDNATTNVLIAGQAADSPGTFTSANGNISSRAQTTATVAWTDIEPWATNGNYLTPDLTAIVQEIVDRPGWASGNNMAFIFSAGTGCTSRDCQRAAEPYDSESTNAALLTVDFSIVAAAGTPPDLLDGTEGFTLPAGGTMTVSFQVTVDDPLAGGITEIVNTATLNTASLGPYVASVTDAVVRAGVVIEYDNAGFERLGERVTYDHIVQNTGEGVDSYAITMTSKLGWVVELIDPATGAVIAVDADGNGVWDSSVVVNTGTLAPGGTIEYRLRVTVPPGATVGDAESTALRATSDRNPARFDIATDETMAVSAVEPVIFLADNSGVGAAGGTAVYAHRVLNNTGAPATFTLSAARENGAPVWPTAFYWDANGNGIYTPGVDIQITNTQQLANGQSQLIFAVVSVPAGTPDFSTDVVHLTAALTTDPTNVFASVTDTTTVRPPLVMDLSGGGTRSVTAGATAVFPGVLRNFTTVADVMSFTISRSWFFGVDGLNHPTELWITISGTPTRIAADLNGDGTWDAGPGLTTTPTASVDAGGQVTYELRRPVDPLQGPSRDPVTLTATSSNSPVPKERDSVTATLLLAAATDAMLAWFDAGVVNAKVVVEWRTSFEMGTLGFDLRRLDREGGKYFKINPSIIPGLLAYPQGGTYRWVDSSARVGDTLTYVLVEHDVRGRSRVFGPFVVTPAPESDVSKAASLPVGGLSRTVNAGRVRVEGETAFTHKSGGGGQPSGLVKALVRENGLIRLPAGELAQALGLSTDAVIEAIGNGDLWINSEATAPAVSFDIFSDGFETGNTVCWESGCDQPDVEEAGIAWIEASDDGAIYFYGEAIDSPFTRDNVYWIGTGGGRSMAWRSAEPVRLPAAATFSEELHFEEELWPVTSVITDPEGDFWMWDYFFSNTPGSDVKEFPLTVPDVAENSGDARLTLYLQGASVSEITPNHTIAVRLNGTQVGGTWSWNGDDAHIVLVDFPQALLASGDNTLEITALAAPGLDYDVFYLDAIELSYDRLYRARGDRLEATATATGTITVEGFSTDDITVFDLDDAAAPVVLVGAEVAAGKEGFDVSFRAEAGTRFLATTTSAARSPEGLAADTASNLAGGENSGRWVIVAGTGLGDEAENFAAYRRARGMSAVVARVENIYDEFSGGVVTPWAIRDFLRNAVERWADPPQYVFLAGDGSIDYKNYDGLGESLVPAPLAATVDGLVPSDNLLADWLGDDGVPEVAIGRLPAQQPGELASYLAKVEAFEAVSGGWKRHTLWLADDPDIGGEFGDDTEGIIDGLPGDYTVQRVFLGDQSYDDAWVETIDTMNKGALLVNFLGHGGLDRFADEGLLVTDDVAQMTNLGRTPFVSALTCVVGRFDIPDFDTLAEALLLKDGGGAIALWSPAAFSMNADAKRLGSQHVSAIAGGGHTTIGDSVRAALAAYLLDEHDDDDLPRKLILLGDPAVAWN